MANGFVWYELVTNALAWLFIDVAEPVSHLALMNHSRNMGSSNA